MTESEAEYVKELEMLIVDTWYFTPESDRHKMTAPFRLMAQRIHQRTVPPDDGFTDMDCRGKYQDE